MFPAIAGSAVATGSIDKHVSTVLEGVDGTMMSQFGSVLSDSDLAAVITYQRNAFGNSTGDTVQPAQIKSLREGAIGQIVPDSVASLPESNTTMGIN